MTKQIHHKMQAKKNETGNGILYLYLSFLSGALETGILSAGVLQFGVVEGMGLALAYQLGCLARNPLLLSLQGAASIICCSLPLLLVRSNIWGPMMMTILVSASIQSAREWLLPKYPPISVNIKRLYRVSGFVCGILLGSAFGLELLAWTSIAASVIIVAVALRRHNKTPFVNLKREFNSDGFGWMMFAHQMHYFVYVYALLAIYLTAQTPSSEESILWRVMIAAVWFALGWLSYISGRCVLENFLKMSPLHAAIIGHAWVASCLICMAIYNKHPFILGIAWVLGGFGGGSVYAIKILAFSAFSKVDLELWEHFGHVVGTFFSFMLVYLFPDSVALPFLFSTIAALTTLTLLLWKPVSEAAHKCKQQHILPPQQD